MEKRKIRNFLMPDSENLAVWLRQGRRCGQVLMDFLWNSLSVTFDFSTGLCGEHIQNSVFHSGVENLSTESTPDCMSKKR